MGNPSIQTRNIQLAIVVQLSHKPDSVVDTDDTSVPSLIVLITSQCRTCLHPHVSAVFCQEAVQTSCRLAFAQYCHHKGRIHSHIKIFLSYRVDEPAMDGVRV